jgi:hypothetical protein
VAGGALSDRKQAGSLLMFQALRAGLRSQSPSFLALGRPKNAGWSVPIGGGVLPRGLDLFLF